MTDFFHIGNRKLIPLKDVTKIVPYSRDYVARLARDGRIAAAQVNRQWYIDGESLKNFFEHAQLEVQARGDYVRELRKQELDLHEWWNAFLETQKTRREARPQRALQKTLIIVILGLFVGLVVSTVAPMATPAQFASLVTSGQLASVSTVPTIADGDAVPWYETGVIIDDESLKNPTGILLTPQGTSSEAEAFFSDNVTIEATSPTTGLIHSSSSSSSVPFVRIGNQNGDGDTSVQVSP